MERCLLTSWRLSSKPLPSGGTDLGSFCRERGLYPKQLARWRQIAEGANGPNAPNMADQRELQRKN